MTTQGKADAEWMPRIDRQRCTGCRECVNACPTGALAQVNGKATLAYPEACIYCTICEDICPTHAIELPFLICLADPAEDAGDDACEGG